jgi:hypothetical protein
VVAGGGCRRSLLISFMWWPAAVAQGDTQLRAVAWVSWVVELWRGWRATDGEEWVCQLPGGAVVGGGITHSIEGGVVCGLDGGALLGSPSLPCSA